jgi:pantetheine-phosphate adenylyltransferase
MSHENVAVFPGSFDPIHIGHIDIINRALPLFDNIIIAIGENSQKKYLFPLKKRVEWIKKIFEYEKRISVESYRGLTVNYCEKKDVKYILRGLRSSSDFQFERSVAQMNQTINRNIETIFLMTHPSLQSISSSIIRDIYLNKGDISAFVPEQIEHIIEAK